MVTDVDSDFNQSPPYGDVDLYGSDVALINAVTANGASVDAQGLSQFGRRWGAVEMVEPGRLANENPP